MSILPVLQSSHFRQVLDVNKQVTKAKARYGMVPPLYWQETPWDSTTNGTGNDSRLYTLRWGWEGGLPTIWLTRLDGTTCCLGGMERNGNRSGNGSRVINYVGKIEKNAVRKRSQPGSVGNTLRDTGCSKHREKRKSAWSSIGAALMGLEGNVGPALLPSFDHDVAEGVTRDNTGNEQIHSEYLVRSLLHYPGYFTVFSNGSIGRGATPKLCESKRVASTTDITTNQEGSTSRSTKTHIFKH